MRRTVRENLLEVVTEESALVGCRTFPLVSVVHGEWILHVVGCDPSPCENRDVRHRCWLKEARNQGRQHDMITQI